MFPHIYHVTNRNKSGEGSLWHGLRQCGGYSHTIIVFDVSGNFPVPAGEHIIENLSNVTIIGESAPGIVHIVDYPLYLSHARNVTMSGLVFTLKAAPTEKDAVWWRPIGVTADTVNGGICENITIRNCHFRGGSDENLFGPVNIRQHFEKCPDRTAIRNLHIFGCQFYCPFTKWRPRHNFNLMLWACEDFVISQCIFRNANKRSPQVQGTGIIDSCEAHNYGSSAVCVCPPSTVAVEMCNFFPGRNTKKSHPLEMPLSVEGGYGGEVRIFAFSNWVDRHETAFVNEAPDKATLTMLEHEPFSCGRVKVQTENIEVLLHHVDKLLTTDRWIESEDEVGGIPEFYEHHHRPLIPPNTSRDDICRMFWS